MDGGEIPSVDFFVAVSTLFLENTSSSHRHFHTHLPCCIHLDFRISTLSEYFRCLSQSLPLGRLQTTATLPFPQPSGWMGG